MGIFSEPGRIIERKCTACRQTVRIVAGENQEIACCPCCGYSLMEPSPNSIPAAFRQLEQAMTAYRKGEITKDGLQYALRQLDEALELSRYCTLVDTDEFRFIRKFDNDWETKVFSFRGELFAIGRHDLYKTRYQAGCTDGRRRDSSAHASIKAAQQYIRDHFKEMV